MALTEKGAKWVQPFSKGSIGFKPVSWKQKKETPSKYGFTEQDVALYTVPGQTISVKELLERHKVGRPKPVE